MSSFCVKKQAGVKVRSRRRRRRRGGKRKSVKRVGRGRNKISHLKRRNRKKLKVMKRVKTVKRKHRKSKTVISKKYLDGNPFA